MPFIEETRGQIYLRNVSPAPVSLHITNPSRMTSLRSSLLGPSAIAAPVGASSDNYRRATAGRDNAPLLFDTSERGGCITLRPGETMSFNEGDLLSRDDISGIRRLIDVGVLEIVDPLSISGDDPLAYGARVSNVPYGPEVNMAAFAKLQNRMWWKMHYREHPEWFGWMTDEQKRDAANRSMAMPKEPCRCPHCNEVIEEPCSADGKHPLVDIAGRMMDAEIVEMNDNFGRPDCDPLSFPGARQNNDPYRNNVARVQETPTPPKPEPKPTAEGDEIIRKLRNGNAMPDRGWMGDLLVARVKEAPIRPEAPIRRAIPSARAPFRDKPLQEEGRTSWTPPARNDEARVPFPPPAPSVPIDNEQMRRAALMQQMQQNRAAMSETLGEALRSHIPTDADFDQDGVRVNRNAAAFRDLVQGRPEVTPPTFYSPGDTAGRFHGWNGLPELLSRLDGSGMEIPARLDPRNPDPCPPKPKIDRDLVVSVVTEVVTQVLSRLG